MYYLYIIIRNFIQKGKIRMKLLLNIKYFYTKNSFLMSPTDAHILTLMAIIKITFWGRNVGMTSLYNTAIFHIISVSKGHKFCNNHDLR